jgi:murein DD-endopeptidase MepM/ murein hydrolase activator NlpD
LSSPYNGWTDINSFLDHDSPDYTQDGKIVIANGDTALAKNGVESDYFPAYWSESLRQYINYDGHNGYDFGISYVPILAAAGGTIRFADWSSGGYGKMVLIDHQNGYVTLYGHLSKLEVKRGDKVKAGQEIGISGSTGNSTGPHLHFSVFHNCQVTDPYGWSGRGTDPLTSFDSEQATYLWLPGEDPLVLNTPPSWPAFPAGLRLSSHQLKLLKGQRLRVVPPANRLLLLSLPPAGTGQVSPTLALARTEALMSREAVDLAPYLNDLRSQGLIQNYQIMPAAAAVWVRGTATASQLEGLPGVASLTGTESRDLAAAELGLSHSVLAQIGAQRAPSLWPAGFRTAVQDWNPSMVVSAGHALMSGFGLPGDKVTASLWRGTTLEGESNAIADSQTGGFVTMLHSRLGIPVSIRPGDIVSVRSGGRTVRVRVENLSLRARSHRITGKTIGGSTVALSAGASSSVAYWRKLAFAQPNGRFTIPVTSPLLPGTLAVATTVDSAGDQESATATVPGVVATLGSSSLYGWAGDAASTIRVLRHHRLLLSQSIPTMDDGAFATDLRSRGHPITLAAGDVLQVGAPRHQRVFRLPKIASAISLGTTRLEIVGPHMRSVVVNCNASTGQQVTENLQLGKSGRASLSWPSGPIRLGDSATIQVLTKSGDIATAVVEAHRLHIREGSSLLIGTVHPGSSLRIHLESTTGTILGGAVVTSNRINGGFRTRLLDSLGLPSRVSPSQKLIIEDASGSFTSVAPPFSLAVQPATGTIVSRALPHAVTSVDLFDSTDHLHVQSARADAMGNSVIHVRGKTRLSEMKRVRMVIALAGGLSVERDVLLPRSHALVATRQVAGSANKRHVGHS